MVAVHGLLVVAASIIMEHSSRARVIVAAHGLSCCAAQRIFPDQGSNLELAGGFFFFFFNVGLFLIG